MPTDANMNAMPPNEMQDDSLRIPMTAATMPHPQLSRSPAMTSNDLRAELKRCFGFESFRPGQESIVADALAGRDVFAIMPTGGGKSL